MEKNDLFAGYSYADQLKKYSHDLVMAYKAEKEKQKDLQIARKQLLKYADDLNKTVSALNAVNQELREAYIDTVNRLVIAAEYKDEDTGSHIVRISRYSALLAEKLGLPARKVQDILYAAPMHDVGKIGIPDNILMKPGKLTKEEFDFMKTHTTIGAKILANSKSAILQVATQIALSHHEKWNGKGYPQGLSGDVIPLAARIVGLVDTFDALTSKRPYKESYPVEVALEIIRKERGRHFDPDMTDVFLENIDEILKIKSEIDSAEDVAQSDFVLSERDQSERKYSDRITLGR
ncbi:MAG: putative two-component system response regulator [Desulfobacteraceae bacterium Eth-SRB1]|nr:MAG: putative two-component system response regulator [Desulfobacteraceae bacterium Eth-SRB1]